MVTSLPTNHEFDNDIRGPGLVVVEFFSTRSAPCNKIAPLYETLCQKYFPAKFFKVDVDGAAEIAMARNVSVLPTFQFYADGRLVDEIAGTNETVLESRIQQHMVQPLSERFVNNILLREDTISLTSADEILIASLSVPIPYNERERIKVLRQTQLLDSDPHEATFDSITALAKRIFKVPIAAINLIDVNRAWIKSIDGFDTQEGPRNISLCSYTILPESPEVLVIEDLSVDPRSRDNPYVTGPAKLRFYAGAALTVAGVRVGTLCIQDTVPRRGFDIEQRRNLLDLGVALTAIIRERREVAMKAHRDRIAVIVKNMRDVRQPMMALRIATDLIKADEKVINGLLTGAPGGEPIIDSFTLSVAELESSIAQLSVLMEESLTLGEAVLSVAGQLPMDKIDVDRSAIDQVSKPCDLLRVTNDTMNDVAAIDKTDKVTWNVDEKVLVLGHQKSHPDVVKFLLLNVVERAVKIFDSINVSTSFCQRDQVAVFCDSSSAQLNMDGFFVIDIQMCGFQFAAQQPQRQQKEQQLLQQQQQQQQQEPKGDRSSAQLETETEVLVRAINLEAIDRLLRDVGGSRRLASFTSPGPNKIGHIMEVRVPCTIFTGNFSLAPDDADPTTSFSPPKKESPLIDLSKVEDETRAAHPTEAPSLLLPLSALQPLRAPRVLLIGDNLTLKKWLEGKKCVVTSVPNGKRGLMALKGGAFDLALAEFLLPVMLGDETMKAYKEWKAAIPLTAEHNKDMVLMGISATASQEEQEEGFEHGMHYYCSKPVNLEVLELVVKAVRERATLSERLAMINASTEPPDTSDAASEGMERPRPAVQSNTDGNERSQGSGRGWSDAFFQSFRRRTNKVTPG